MIKCEQIRSTVLEERLNELKNKGYEITFVLSDYCGRGVMGYTIIYNTSVSTLVGSIQNLTINNSNCEVKENEI